MDETHYLKKELYALIATDPSIFDFLQNGSLDGLWYWDIENPENEWMNAKFWELLGYDPSEKKHLAKEWQDLINPDDLKVAIENFQKHCENPDHPYDQIVRYRHKNGKTIWVRCRGIAIRNSEGKPVRMLGAHNDLTELKELEENLRLMASTDSLTGLKNRRCFEEHFAWTLHNRVRNPEVFSLAIADIDFFKNINDTYGHQTGDAVLKAVADAIRQGCRENDFLARWGGEEFIVLLHGANREESLEIARRIRQHISEICIVATKITASLGVSTYPSEIQETSRKFMEECIAEADKALFIAKKSGRDRAVHGTNTD